MNPILSLDPHHIITQHGAQLRTSSLKVAEAFGKRHDNVLRALNALDCSPEFRSLNFEVTAEARTIGAVQRSVTFYEMTKDGFMFLVMGFTGAKAARVKEAYIAAFNWMAEQLAAPSSIPGPVAAEARGLALDYFGRCRQAVTAAGGKPPRWDHAAEQRIADQMAALLVTGRRWLLAFGVDGQPQLSAVPAGAVVIDPTDGQRLAELLRLHVPTAEVPGVMSACLDRLAPLAART